MLVGRWVAWGFIPVVIFLLPVLLFLVFFEVITFSFEKLGLSDGAAIALVSLSLVGSMVNIPLTQRKVAIEEPSRVPYPFSFFFYRPPRVARQVIAINLGGAIIPFVFSLYLLAIEKAPLLQTIIATAVVAAVAKIVARPQPGRGILMPLWIPPVLAGMALILASDNVAPVAYVCGSMGTLIGADLLNYRSFDKLGGQVLSIWWYWCLRRHLPCRGRRGAPHPSYLRRRAPPRHPHLGLTRTSPESIASPQCPTGAASPW